MEEFDAIARYFAPLASPGGLGLQDDAALLSPSSDKELVLTTDTIIESVHFLPDTAPEDIAWKLLGVNVSDLAAMGAMPLHYLLALTLPRGSKENWLQRFSTGLKDGMVAYGGSLLGGDTTSHNGAFVLTLTAIGEVPRGQALQRKGAAVGDAVFVSGIIGESYLGLNHPTSPYLQRYLRPTPRIALGQALRGIASACADVSDGLVADVGHIACASGVSISLNLQEIPLPVEAKALGIPATDLITAGDDYELVFTVPSSRVAALEAKQLPVTRIGAVVAGSGVTVYDTAGQPVILAKKGWVHG